MNERVDIELGGLVRSYHPDPKISGFIDRIWTIKQSVESYSEEDYYYEVRVDKSIVDAYKGICKVLCSRGEVCKKLTPTKEAVESLKQALESINSTYLTQLEEQYKKRVADHKKLMEYVREL